MKKLSYIYVIIIILHGCKTTKYGQGYYSNIGKALKNKTEVRILDLSDNNLNELPSNIGDLKYLEKLWINSNNLEYLPPSIGNLSNLKELVVARNNLKELPRTIGKLTKLEILHLFRNDLSTLPLTNMKKMISLKKIILVGNHITEEYIRPLKKALPDCKITVYANL